MQIALKDLYMQAQGASSYFTWMCSTSAKCNVFVFVFFLEMWKSACYLTLSDCCNFCFRVLNSKKKRKKKKRFFSVTPTPAYKYWLLSFNPVYDRPFVSHKNIVFLNFQSTFVTWKRIHTSLRDGQSKMQCSRTLACAGSVQHALHLLLPPPRRASRGCRASPPEMSTVRIFSCLLWTVLCTLCST